MAQEKFVKRLVGKAEVENALQRLDMLTKEESLMTAARTLESTHHINVNVKATRELTHRIDDNMRQVREVTYDVRAGVDVIKEGTRSVHDDVKLARHSASIFSNSCTYRSFPVTAINELQRSLLPDTVIIDRWG